MSAVSYSQFNPAQRGGVLAIGLAGALSLVFSTLALIQIAITLAAHYRLPSAVQQEHKDRARGVRFLSSQYGWLFINLLLGCVVQSSGFVVCLLWARQGGISVQPVEATCTAQGLLIEFGTLQGAFSSFLIALLIFCSIVFAFKPSNLLLFAVTLSTWLLVGLLTLLGPVALSGGSPFITWTGGWCWIRGTRMAERLWLQYVWCWSAAATNFLLYSAIVVKVYLDTQPTSGKGQHCCFATLRALVPWARKSGASPSDDDHDGSTGKEEITLSMEQTQGERRIGGRLRRHNVALTMLLYPILYFITILPITILRIRILAGRTLSQRDIPFVATGGVFLASSGWSFAILYAATLGFVSLPSSWKSGTASEDQSQGVMASTVRAVRNSLTGRRRSSVADPSPTSIQINFSVSSPTTTDDSPASLTPRAFPRLQHHKSASEGRLQPAFTPLETVHTGEVALATAPR